MRALRLIRRFSDKLPVPKTFEEEELAAKEKIYAERIEDEKLNWEIIFPSVPKENSLRPEYKDDLPSLFGKSDEEDTTAFFLEDTKEVQYIYSPGKALEFDENGLALIFDSSSRFYWPEKLKYGWRVSVLALFGLGIAIQPFAYSNIHIFLGLSLPFIALSRCLIVDKIFLTKDGKQIKVNYRRFKFLPRTKTIDISSFKEPKGDAFIIWDVYEFPDDLKTYNETSSMERIAFAKYISWWSFLMLPKKPKYVNREVLINALNGIFIDPQQQGKEEIEQRYFVLYKKNENKA
ncbi:unnamed protein product [Blepharisma stoltei]|uniref:Uncharacterized protein n=1 Tax=Blepharisma stoltei TaxID=1481888 RepID=A0AAU9IFB1_9CILI|nr:unnamed protein product [Blepharisma stoltei]